MKSLPIVFTNFHFRIQELDVFLDDWEVSEDLNVSILLYYSTWYDSLVDVCDKGTLIVIIR